MLGDPFDHRLCLEIGEVPGAQREDSMNWVVFGLSGREEEMREPSLDTMKETQLIVPQF